MERLSSASTPASADGAALLRLLFGGKWRLRVLQELVKNPARLSQLRRVIPDVSKKVLIDTLHDLEALGWIVRREYPSKQKRVEYSLAEQWEESIRKLVSSVTETEPP